MPSTMLPQSPNRNKSYADRPKKSIPNINVDHEPPDMPLSQQPAAQNKYRPVLKDYINSNPNDNG